MKQALLISYYFPPSGGPGVQRALKFVKYLPQFGWHPTVLTVAPEDAAYPHIDASLEAEVPSDVDVVRTKSWDPYGGYARLLGKNKEDTVGVSFGGESRPSPVQRLGRFVRANLFVPDARVGWVPFALRKARSLIGNRSFDAILTTGPPHSTHLAGLRLAQSTGIPWLADFRDPWTKIDYQQELPTGGIARRVDAALERKVLKTANRITTVSESILKSLENEASRQVDLIMNGFDPEDFHDEAEVRPSESEVVIRHIGNVPSARTPEALWQALTTDELRSARVELVGSVDPVVLESATEHGVASRVIVSDYVRHPEAVRLMKSADLLLLVINNVEGARGIMTGKLFEYIGSGRPILGIGPIDGDAAAAIRRVSGGEMFAYDDVDGIASFLRSYVASKERGERSRGASREEAQYYSRVSQTKKLARILDEMTSTTNTDHAPDRTDR